MDCTLANAAKYEAEKELSEKVYMKVCALTSMYPPSEEFFTCFSEETGLFFIKPNQHGFFHIMHYLFTTLDPDEFSKRFYWPITDKRSESEFRTTTVEYIKELKEKHQFQTSVNTNYLTVMPGGYKFLTFLDDLVSFVIKKRIAAHEEEFHEYGVIGKSDYEFNLSETIKEFGISTQAIEKYEEELDRQTVKMEEQIDALKNELKKLSSEVGLPFETLTNGDFLRTFENTVDEMQKTFIVESTTINSLDAPLVEYNCALENFDDSIESANNEKDKSIATINDHFGNDPDESLLHREFQMDSPFEKRMLINNLIEVINNAFPTIVSSLSTNDDEENNCNKIIHSELSKFEEQTTEIQKHLSECQETLSQYMKARDTKLQQNLNGTTDNDIETMMRVISTPPIKLEPIERTFQSSFRLPMIKKETDVGSITTPTIKLVVKTPKTNTTIRTKIKIEDPIELLCRNPKGQTTPMRGSLLYQSSKKSLFEFDICAKLSPETPKHVIPMETILHDKEQTPLTPFAVNDCTQIPRSDSNLSMVKKVLNASVNVHDLSASPSGRLNALVNAGEIPKIKMNDITLQNFDTTLMESENNALPMNDENDPNALNFQAINICSDIDEIAIADISDTILKDIAM